jgi:hypothetical protein
LGCLGLPGFFLMGLIFKKISAPAALNIGVRFNRAIFGLK